MSIIEKLENKLEKEPLSLLFVHLVEEYRKAGRIREAIKLCHRGIENHPNYWSAYVSLGKCYYDKGDLERAKDNLERATSAMPDNMQAIMLLVEIYEKLDYWDKALEHLKLVQLLSPDEKIDARIRDLERKLHLGDESPTIQFSVSLIKESLSNEEGMTIHMPKEELLKEIERQKEIALQKEIESQKQEETLSNTGKIDAEAVKQIVASHSPLKEEVKEEEEDLAESFETKKYTNLEETIEKSEGEPVEILSLIKPVLLAVEGASRKEIEEARAKEVVEEQKQEVDTFTQEITTQTLGEIYISQGHFDKAIKIYQKIVLAEPGNAAAINRLKQLMDEFNKSNAQMNKQFFKEETSLDEPEKSKTATKGTERKKRISTLENWLLTMRKEKDLKAK